METQEILAIGEDIKKRCGRINTCFVRLLNVKGLYTSIGCNIALIEYRGYGRSEGSPSEEGIYMDAQAALDFLLTREDLATDKIILFGRSLGGAVAVDLATRLVGVVRTDLG